MKKIGVLRFSGTNCDRDVFSWIQLKGFHPEYLWHLDQFAINDYEALILPGGFSFGDYLRSGALAARSPVMKSVKEFSKQGGPVLGICNGFQILCEAELLPGALVKNEGRRFIDDWVDLQCVGVSSRFASQVKGSIRLPIAHGDGRYYLPEKDLQALWDSGQVWFQYRNENPNGSVQGIAGVLSKNKNIAGLMPHPERAIADWMGGTDGWSFL